MDKAYAYDNYLAKVYEHSPFLSTDMGSVIQFYVNTVVEQGGPVLEFGTATGLFTIPIARAGVEIDTIDISDQMIAAFHKNLEHEETAVKDKITLHQMDFGEVKLNKKFRCVIFPDNALIAVQSLEQQLKLLKIAFDHLESGGILVFDVFTPDLNLLNQKKDYSFCEFTIPEEPDHYYLGHRYTSVKPLRQLLNIDFIHEKYTATGEFVEKKHSSIYFRYMFPSELRLALTLIGFRIRKYMEDFVTLDKKVQYETPQICIAFKP
ncbi:class I SAM-dependent DNA methyltransferase [Paenibacillus typhae]|uniref:class I SAM-dependent DNA methyltransferase n=1 Tax=Paenibacillus typhae TaxID=1174501 RepID=UPI001C8D8A39|nr:class I SAM-dependent methyltransferase [Paenibacillus typhae]MBY0009758.1 class I SAM-dependent methyltransferase [Paenibacillus typhae]